MGSDPKLRQDLKYDIREMLAKEQQTRNLGLDQVSRLMEVDLSRRDLEFFQRMARFERVRSKDKIDFHLVDATEVIGFIAPNSNDLQHYLATACSLELGPELYVSSLTLDEISRVFHALRSKIDRYGYARSARRAEMSEHLKRLVSDAYQIHRFHYLMKRGRFKRLDESFLKPGSILAEQFAQEYSSSLSEIHRRRRISINPAAIEVDAYNYAILRVSALDPHETGGRIGLVTRDKVLYSIDAANERSSAVFSPWEYAFRLFLDSQEDANASWPQGRIYNQSIQVNAQIDALVRAQVDDQMGEGKRLELQQIVAKLGFLGKRSEDFANLIGCMYQWLSDEKIWDLQGNEKSLLARDEEAEWQYLLGDLDEVIFETSLSLEGVQRG